LNASIFKHACILISTASPVLIGRGGKGTAIGYFFTLKKGINMGKGLSKLQKSILKMAYRNRRHVENKDVLIEFYKFPPHAPGPSHVSGTPQIFDRHEIGINRYRSASVSVVKAFNRLVKRGLAIREYNNGIVLTEEGFKVAKMLV